MQAARSPLPMPELTARQRSVLHAVVQRFLRSGAAVASRAICAGLNISAATARVELVRLTEMGLLAQPHPSAGRSPTGAGLRFYVERLMRQRRPSCADRDAFEAALRGDGAPRSQWRAATRELAARCTMTVLLRRPPVERALVERLEMVYLAERRVLAVALLEDGTVLNRMLHTDSPVTPKLVAGASELFAARFAGGPLEAIRARLRIELDAAREANRPSTPLLRLAASALPPSTPPSEAVIIEGRRHLMTGSLVVGGEMGGVLDTAEEKEVLLDLLEAFGCAGASSSPRVILGIDTALPVLQGRALVSAPYGRPGGATGTVAVIGPLRMQYAKVVPWVDFTAGALSRLAHSAA